MHLKKHVWALTALLMAAALASCNIGKAPEPTPDVNGIYTSAAQTMIAALNVQQTQTAQAVTATPLVIPSPLATFTPLATFAIGTGSIPFGTTPFTLGTPGAGVTTIPTPVGGTAASLASGCNNLAFISDVTIPDGTVFRPGKDFLKTWRVENTGTCAWDDGYALVYQGGTLDGYDIPINRKSDFIYPGESVDYSVKLTASLQPNTYTECWRMRGDNGAFFGSFLCVVIKVQK